MYPQAVQRLSLKTGRRSYAILLTKDTLLNSKNKYIQNCISRVTVEENQYAIKKRILEEEENEEIKVKEFKTLKRPTKRETVSIPE